MSRLGKLGSLEAPDTPLPSHPDCCVLEIFGEAAGLLITEEYGVVFHAASKKAWSLDRRVFQRIEDAERALRALLDPDGKKSKGSSHSANR